MTSLTVEIIYEAAKLICNNPTDLQVLREQKRIFNQQVNVLINYAKEAEPRAGGREGK